MRTTVLLLALLGVLFMPACDRPVALEGDVWDGPAIAYSGYRAGQSPGGVLPSQEQVAEDLRILAKHWRVIRVYAADRHGQDVLEVIRRENLDLDASLDPQSDE